jgi:transcriptional regulator with GAF, ATPase, and Fis domain
LAEAFVKVNCAAFRELLESELFGYEKGAFTGAYRQNQGNLNLPMVDHFPDEIADISPSLQAKLQVLQDREFSKLEGREIFVWGCPCSGSNE